ncbi:MAG: response regulator [Hyphomicrobiaceae bacterium]|nr:response regulator [Hyphomicrobiaceae bacterium]
MTAKRSVRGRLMMTLGVLASLTLMAGGIGWLGLTRTERTLETLQAETLADVRRVLTLAERGASLAALAPAIVDARDPAGLDAGRRGLEDRLDEFLELVNRLPALGNPAIAPTVEPSIVRLADRLDGIVRNLIDITAEAIDSRARLADARARVAAAEAEARAGTIVDADIWRGLAALNAALAAVDIPEIEAARAAFPAFAAAGASPLASRLATLADVFDVRILDLSIRNRTRFCLAAIVVSSADLTSMVKIYASAVERSGRARAETTADELRAGKILVLLVGALALIGSLGFANAFMRDVVEKLRGTAGAMRRLADGDTTAEAPGLDRSDEIGELARSFQVFKAQASERDMIERQLRQAQKMEAIGQLTGGIAHDFNNLLAAITSNVQLILDAADPGSRTRLRALRALEATDHGAAMVQRLLAFGRRQMLSPEPTDVDALIGDLVDLLSSSVGAGIALDHQPAPGDPSGAAVHAMVDPGQLENALINLVFNARDAIGGRGRIRLATRAGTDGMVRIEVADDGTGMNPETLGRIFEPFFTTKPAGAGSGLGLSMVYGFVRQSGGRIAVASEPGQGTTVSIDLPAVAAPYRPAAPVQARGADTDDIRRRVLVVEDDPTLRLSIVDVLTSLGHTVAGVASAEAALDWLAAHAADLLLTDVALGAGMDGLELIGEVRRRHPAMAVLATSAYARELPPDVPVLPKPFRREDLTRALALAVAAPLSPAETAPAPIA